MNIQEKQAAVEELGVRFSGAPASFLIQYKGCSCAELTTLRKELRPHGASFAVVKNTLAKRALGEAVASKLEDALQGPTGVVWAGADPVLPAKVLSKFAKGKEHFSVKAAVVEGKVIDSAGVESLASLPSREELFAKLLAVINAPAIKLLQTINAPAGQLVRLLEAWRAELEKRSGQ